MCLYIVPQQSVSSIEVSLTRSILASVDVSDTRRLAMIRHTTILGRFSEDYLSVWTRLSFRDYLFSDYYV